MTKANNTKHGFSLIELSIALLLIGLFAGAAMQSYHHYMVTHAVNITKSKGNAISISLQKYYLANANLPCPADPTLAVTDPNAGIANCGGGNVLTVGGDGASVYEGSIPYTTLNNANTGGLQAEDTYDGWGRKLAYYVSAPLTTGTISESSLTSSANMGIDIWAPLQDPANPGAQLAGSTPPTADGLEWAPYINTTAQQKFELVVFSYGSSGRGGYTSAGLQYAPCSGAGIDLLNCPGQPGASTGALYVEAPQGSTTFNIRSLNAGNASFYDNYLLAYQVSTAIDFWNTQNSTYTTYNPSSPLGYVGINNQSPQQPVDVGGSILVQGSVLAGGTSQQQTSFCHGANCFSPSSIAGGPGTVNPGGMSCGSNTTMAGFALNGPQCANTLGFNYPYPMACAGNSNGPQFITAIDSLGNITCTQFYYQ